MIVSFDEMQAKNGSIIVRQTSYSFLYSSYIYLVIGFIIKGKLYNFGINLLKLYSPFFQLIQRTIYYNFFQPGAKTHSSLISMNLPECFQKRLLHYIFRFMLIIKNSQTYTIHTFIIQFIQ